MTEINKERKMFINKLNQLYKPERVLYYYEADDTEIAELYAGNVKEEIGRYTHAFGTYDYPGVFYVKELGKPVIGIEYRADDPQVVYPTGFQSVTIKGSFFYSIEIDNEFEISRETIEKLFRRIAEDGDAHRIYSDLSIKEDPEVVSIFASDDKIRILYECQVDNDRAGDLMNDDYEKMDLKALYEKAFYDPITGHYTWNHLVPFLEMPMLKGIHDYAFVHFDVKEFRVINEVYGHIAANKVLCNIVKAMNESDFIYTSARCHNDNFAMMIKDMPQEEMLRTLQKFFDDLSCLEEDENYRIYYRCGVVSMQRSMLSGNRVADAGKLAQSLGTNHNKTDIIVYTDKMHADILWGNYIKAYLETAVANDEFLVYLQPKYDIHTEKIRGAEALIRWNYKKKEFLYPGKFVPFFERDGSIGKIDDIVLKKVCEALEKWKKEGKPLYPISVNLSRNRLYDKNLVSKLTDIVDAYHVDHSLIDFELTESASYDNTEQMINVLNMLRDKGFHISMDDFGTGYSSFSLLTRMPLNTLKIDKSFVDNIGITEEKEEDVIVIKHIISLAKELGFICLAEGAESKAQVDKLRILGCEVIQGYYYSKPIPIEEYERKL